MTLDPPNGLYGNRIIAADLCGIPAGNATLSANTLTRITLPAGWQNGVGPGGAELELVASSLAYAMVWSVNYVLADTTVGLIATINAAPSPTSGGNGVFCLKTAAAIPPFSEGIPVQIEDAPVNATTHGTIRAYGKLFRNHSAKTPQGVQSLDFYLMSGSMASVAADSTIWSWSPLVADPYGIPLVANLPRKLRLPPWAAFIGLKAAGTPVVNATFTGWAGGQ